MLEIKNIYKTFNKGTVNEKKALNGVSFTLNDGDFVTVIGGNGAGKSTTLNAVAGVWPVDSGSIIIDGINVTGLPEHKRAKYLGRVFQDPMTFLNPVLRIQTQLIEPIINHNPGISKKEAIERAIELMRKVGIPSPETRIRQYPFQFSGGMRQRIIIAIALACDPKVIIADEPTTALDVTIQAQVLELISNLKDEIDSSIIMITHDLGVVASICDRIAIMYGGKIVEQGTTDEIFYDPKHPYTKGLLSCISNPEELERKELHPIPGSPPDLLNIADNCPFADRCENAMKVCKMAMPEMKQFSDTHICSCWLNHPMAQGKGGAVHE